MADFDEIEPALIVTHQVVRHQKASLDWIAITRHSSSQSLHWVNAVSESVRDQMIDNFLTVLPTISNTSTGSVWPTNLWSSERKPRSTTATSWSGSRYCATSWRAWRSDGSDCPAETKYRLFQRESRFAHLSSSSSLRDMDRRIGQLKSLFTRLFFWLGVFYATAIIQDCPLGTFYLSFHDRSNSLTYLLWLFVKG